MPVDRSRLPSPGSEPAFHFPPVLTRRLENGLTVRAVARRGLPIVVYLVLVRAGSGADPAEGAGLASLTADLLDEGTATRSAIDIASALQSIGASLETDVGPDAAMLFVGTLVKHVPVALDILAEVLAGPIFAPHEFDRLRDQRLTRLVQLRDLAPTLADQAFVRAVYGTHPYGHLAIGTEEGIRHATRAAAAAFYAARYRPDSTTMMVAGDVEAEAAIAEVERALGAWRAGRLTAPADVDKPAETLAATRVFLVDKPGAAQSELRIGHLAVPRRSPDFETLQVLNHALGGQFVSRINLNLREGKGYTYGARSSFEARRGRGPFVTQAAVQAAVTKEAIQEVLRELDDIRGPRPVTPEELAAAKASIIRGFAKNFETPEQIARATAQLALYDLPDDYFETYLRHVSAVTADDVTRAAQAHLHPDRLSIVTVGPASSVLPGLRELGFGEPIL